MSVVRALGLLVAGFAAFLAAACSSNEAAGPANAPPGVHIEAPRVIHEGIEAAVTIHVDDADSATWHAVVDWGDGSVNELTGVRGAAPMELRHRYLENGSYRLHVITGDSDGGAAETRALIEVTPRKLVFMQGIGSKARCDGDRSFSGAPGWVANLLATTTGATLPAISADDFLYYSYSGRYCGNVGAFADYGEDDTCGGIDEPDAAAAHLRTLVDAAAPAKVTILAHSMGGLVAAYLAGNDPEWAREHIASVVTFDSPLGGVPQMNLLALRVGGDCPFDSGSIADLDDRNGELLNVAAAAGGAVPFYNLDASKREGPFSGIRQAVPSSRTHLEGEQGNWQIGTRHNALWRELPDGEDGDLMMQVVACAIALIPGSACMTG